MVFTARADTGIHVGLAWQWSTLTLTVDHDGSQYSLCTIAPATTRNAVRIALKRQSRARRARGRLRSTTATLQSVQERESSVPEVHGTSVSPGRCLQRPDAVFPTVSVAPTAFKGLSCIITTNLDDAWRVRSQTFH